MKWKDLELTVTEDEKVRNCHLCSETVTYAETQQELDELAKQGKCVATSQDGPSKKTDYSKLSPPIMGRLCPKPPEPEPEPEKKTLWGRLKEKLLG